MIWDVFKFSCVIFQTQWGVRWIIEMIITYLFLINLLKDFTPFKMFLNRIFNISVYGLRQRIKGLQTLYLIVNFYTIVVARYSNILAYENWIDFTLIAGQYFCDDTKDVWLQNNVLWY